MFVPPNEHRSERSEQSNTAPRARAAKVRCASVGGAQPTSAGTMSETRFSSREEWRTSRPPAPRARAQPQENGWSSGQVWVDRSFCATCEPKLAVWR